VGGGPLTTGRFALALAIALGAVAALTVVVTAIEPGAAHVATAFVVITIGALVTDRIVRRRK
jgi:hypothetical protein